MKTIPLTQGKVTLVDDDVFEWASKLKWFALRRRAGFVAARWAPTVNKKRKCLLLHREIMKPPANLEVDHIFGDPLDNRRKHLRIVTGLQNTWAFRIPQKNKTSKFRGVHLHTEGKWEARIGLPSGRKYLGLFQAEEDAARAYDTAASQFYGQYAQLNLTSTK